MKTTKEEQETFIRFDEAGQEAEVWTASPVVYRRMTKRGFKAEKLDDQSWRFEISKKECRLPSKRKVLSPIQIARMKEHGQKMVSNIRAKQGDA